MARADITLTAVDQTRAAFDSVKRNLGDVERVAGSLSSTLAGLGAGLSAGALIGFVRSSIDAADNLGKLSQKVGVTVESLSELQYAGKLADVSTEQLGDRLRKLSVNLTEAANGSKEMRAAFGAVGISAAELVSLKPDQALARIAEAFANTEDGASKTALAVRLFGRSGSDLIPLLNAGAAGLRTAADEARRFGLIVSSDSARAAEQFNDNLTRMTSSAQALGVQLANVLLPSLTRFTDELLEGQRIFGSFGSAFLNIGVGIDPFKGLGDNLKKYRTEVERLTALLANPDIKGTKLAANLQAGLDTAQKRLEFLKYQQRQQIGAGGDGNTDARDRRLQAGERRAQNFRLPDAPAASSSGGGGGMRDGTDRIAALGAQMYLDQWADLAKQAKQIQDDLLTQFEEGNEAAARATKEQVDTLERILSGTKSGQERATFKDLEALNDALIVGRINAEEYEEAYGTIQERLNEIRGVARETAADLSDGGTKALRDLQFAVEGWGRNFTNTLASAVETGKLQFEDLVQSVLRDLLRLQIQQSITAPLFKALQGGVGNLFGGRTPTPTPAGSPFADPIPKANGGPVSPSSLYMVGERGPELFIPNTAGTIIPNGASGTNLTLVVNVDARSDINAVRQAVRESSYLAQAELARAARRG